MRGSRRLLALTIVGCMGLAACGDSDSDSSGDTTIIAASGAAVSTSAGSAESTAPAATTAATAAPTTAPATTTATSAAPSTTSAAGGLTDSCVQGSWLLDDAATSELLTTLLPGIPITTTGSMTLDFTGTTVRQFVNIVATFTVPNGSVSGALDQQFDGTYRIEGGNLRITNTAIQGGWGNFTGTMGGVAVNVPMPTPTEIPPLSGGPTTCTADTLAIAYTSGLAGTTANFRRI